MLTLQTEVIFRAYPGKFPELANKMRLIEIAAEIGDFSKRVWFRMSSKFQ